MNYDGGKGQAGMYQRIINQMPPHSLYVEPFLGMGAVLRAKLPAMASIGIDRDAAVVAAWRNHGLAGVEVRQGDAFDYLESGRFDDRTVIYCDPPYLFSTRRSHRPIYRCELEDSDHQRLLAILTRLDCPVLLSGYWSEMYGRHLRGWRAVNFQAMTRAGKPATEWLWMNFPEPVELHDYRYLGEGFRERERIKRKVSRWKARLAAMPTLERRALSAALAEVVAAGSTRSYIGEKGDVAGGIVIPGDIVETIEG